MTETRGVPRSVIIAFSLLALVTAGWCIYWFSFRAKLQSDVAELRAALAEAGLKLECATETWGGFPFRYELDCAKPRLHGELRGRRIDAGTEDLRLYMQAYNPFHIMALANGPTLVNGRRISHATARASLRYDTAGNWDAAAELPQADMAEEAKAGMVKVFARVLDGKLQLASDTEALLIAATKLPPANLAGTAEMDAAILNAPDPLQFAAASATPVAVKTLKLSSGDVTLEGTGQLKLDSAGRLNGKISSTVNNLDALLVILAAPLHLSPEEVTGVRTVIGLLGDNQEGAPAKFDVIAKDGELYFGPFKFADVPPLR